MVSLSARIGGGAVATFGLVLALLSASAPAAAAPDAEIDVTFDCEASAWVVTSDKAIGNIVVSDGVDDVKTVFQDRPYSAVVADADAVTLWVKSGRVKSGDGPGYGERFDLEPPDCGEGGHGDGDVTGELTVTLVWIGVADLDLAVTEPGGEKLWYGNGTTSSGGSISDAVPACDSAADAVHVEEATWDGGAPAGDYIIAVDLFNACGLAAPEFTVTVSAGAVQVLHTTSAGDDFLTGFAYPPAP